MITTITICGCRSSTSMWRIVAVSSGGAETIARRFVICDSVSVVARIASSTSRRVSSSSSERALALGRQQAIDEVAKAHVGRHAAGGGVRVGQQPVLLEHRELVADGRRTGLQLGVGRERARRDGLDGRLVGEHDLAQDQLLARREHVVDCRSAVWRAGFGSGAGGTACAERGVSNMYRSARVIRHPAGGDLQRGAASRARRRVISSAPSAATRLCASPAQRSMTSASPAAARGPAASEVRWLTSG